MQTHFTEKSQKHLRTLVTERSSTPTKKTLIPWLKHKSPNVILTFHDRLQVTSLIDFLRPSEGKVLFFRSPYRCQWLKWAELDKFKDEDNMEDLETSVVLQPHFTRAKFEDVDPQPTKPHQKRSDIILFFYIGNQSCCLMPASLVGF